MRDFLILAIVIAGAGIALWRPWIGILVWTWVSLMNPHRYAWGIAYDAPVAAIVAAATLLGLLFTRDKDHPFKGSPPVILAILMVWITISWLMGLDRTDDYPLWDKVMKVILMVLVALMLLRTKQHILALAAVCAVSLGILGVKGGLFTILNGGNYRVWGPPESFIADNNHFATALVMTIPLLRFLQLQLNSRWARRGMSMAMILVAASVLGSHSRGGLLAISAMVMLFWWRGGNRVPAAIVIGIVSLALVAFMPGVWGDRMQSITDYESDASAMGRLTAWAVAWAIGLDYPFGVGFNAARVELFAAYAPGSGIGTPVAHSIYFQILGNHGFIGLGLFLLLWLTTWRTASRIRKEAVGIAEAKWCFDLASLCQASLVGYLVGGAFLNLAYFDLPYYIMVLLVLTAAWVKNKSWQSEPDHKRGEAVAPALLSSHA